MDTASNVRLGEARIVNLYQNFCYSPLDLECDAGLKVAGYGFARRGLVTIIHRATPGREKWRGVSLLLIRRRPGRVKQFLIGLNTVGVEY